MHLRYFLHLSLLSTALATPHKLARRALLGEACSSFNPCDGGSVCSRTLNSGGADVCAGDGEVVDGAPCQFPIQCLSGSCSGTCDPTTGTPGVGTTLEDAFCSTSSACATGYCRLSDKLCKKPSDFTGLAIGEACSEDLQCTSPSTCTCPFGVGATCSVDVKTCSLLPIGSTCSADSTCDSFFCSQGSTCAPVTTAVNDGDHCLFSSMCSSPSTCGCRTPGCASTDDYICTPPAKLAIGIACGFDSDCDSAFCFSSSCTDPNGFTAKEGEHCLAADQCASGSTCECNTGGSCLTSDSNICKSPAKTATGQLCSDGGSCFSGTCQDGTCAPLSPPGEVAATCSADPDCLGWSEQENISSGYCQTQNDGSPSVCRVSEVKATGENCSGASQHCFSGQDRCLQRPGDSKYCEPPTSLAAEGEACSADADCTSPATCSGAVTNPDPSRGIIPGICKGSSVTIVATGGDCDGSTTVCWSGKDQCSASKCLGPKTLKAAGQACSATADCAAPSSGTVSCDGIVSTVGSGICKVSGGSSGTNPGTNPGDKPPVGSNPDDDQTVTITTTDFVTQTVNGVVTVVPQPRTITTVQRAGAGGGSTTTPRSAGTGTQRAAATGSPTSGAGRGVQGVATALVVLGTLVSLLA